ncbi:MAG: chromosomal replication initiator protein DnaA [Elusimicrobiota bacterium]
MHIDPENIWNKTKENLKPDLPGETFELWFPPTKAVSISDNTLKVAVPNQYFLDRMEKYSDLVMSSLKTITDKELKVNFHVSNELAKYTPPPKSDIPEPTFQPRPETSFPASDFNPRYTFESFVVASSNRFAHAVAEAVANDPGKRYNPFFIYAGVGLGKTHLLHAIGHKSKKNNPREKVLYVTCEKFTNEWIDSLRNSKPHHFKSKYLRSSILLIDDIQFLEEKEGTQETFFHIFNDLIEAQKQIVLTSDRPPDKFKTLEERLRSRFQWGVITDIQPPDLETRIAILKSKAEMEDLEVPNDVLIYIAKHVKDNIRKLEGALIRIYAFASLTGSEITVESTKEILKDIIDKEKSTEIVSISCIQDVVARRYHKDIKDIKGKSRRKDIVFPRHLAMYLCRKLTENSTTQIGNEFGNRDHSTVMYATNAIRKKIKQDPYFKTILEDIVKEIKVKCEQ